MITPGNAGTLDMLNRGEISVGPVWVDMFYTWMADGKLPPSMKLKLVAPGMPGQPMYYAVPAKAQNTKLAEEFDASRMVLQTAELYREICACQPKLSPLAPN